jgi:hypothetical protein
MNYYRIEGSERRNRACFALTIVASTKEKAIETFKDLYRESNEWQEPKKIKITSIEPK